MNEVTVALGGKLPKGDANGLVDLGNKLTIDREARKQIRAAIVLFDVKDVKEDTDDASMVATLRIRRIEVLQDPEDFGLMQRLLMREWERRTGQTVLPFALEEDVNILFKNFHPEMFDEDERTPGDIDDDLSIEEDEEEVG